MIRFISRLKAVSLPIVLVSSLLSAGHQLGYAEETSQNKPPSNPSISVKAEVDRAFITIGDPVEYTITIRHDPAIKILSNIPSPAGDILKIKKIEEFKREEKGMTVEGRTFKLTAFRLGEFILDPVKIEYRSGSNPTQSISTEKIFLTVKSVDAGQPKEDIKGLKGVLEIVQKWMRVLLVILGLGLTALIVFILYTRFKKKRAEGASPETLLSPEEEAMLHLNQLFDSDLIRKGKTKEYYLKLSEILRIFFERKFHILAVESTTFEALRLLRNKELPVDLMQKIEEVLEAADLAKFAKWQPEPVMILNINKKSKEIVEELTPKEQPEAQSGV